MILRCRLFALIFSLTMLAPKAFPQVKYPVEVKMDPRSGEYTVYSSPLNWTFGGSIGRAVTHLKSGEGKDSIGNYKMIHFTWKDTINYEVTIRWYEEVPVVIFSLSLPDGANRSPGAFPHFTTFPQRLFHYSFQNDNFAPPQFRLNETSTPWLLFDSNKNACILSPASDFIVSLLSGDGKAEMISGLNKGVKQLPANFVHSTLLVMDNGIQKSWDEWGSALRSVYHRERTANDADTVLNYFGYWTDNGADYYYNYDTTKGYANTLLALCRRYKEEGIPLGYLQLDSWWYDKSITDVEGKPLADHKNAALPYGPWNRYGGLIKYEADSFLFPAGLAAFQKDLGLPLVTHNRWIDPKSPYHDEYKISGYAAIDPRFWMDRMTYLGKSGVVCYEQDWLNYIYNKSPQMAMDVAIGNAFTDGMADAAKAKGESLQYCMAMPRDFLQGIKYNNLTTIRTSEDRLDPEKWMPFVFTSQLAWEMGILPWCDVFKSNELGNMIVAVLSDGPVGTGDAIGKENKLNILLACRNDGVLVKPDVPLLPVDDDYVQMAKGKKQPIFAYTYTRHSDLTTGYLFAFADGKEANDSLHFQPAEFGMKGDVVIYEPVINKLKAVNVDEVFSDVLSQEKYRFYMIAPVTTCGIAFLGDVNKIAATGKKRISAIVSTEKSMRVTVLFAAGEKEIILHGYSEYPVTSDKGEIMYDTGTHTFTAKLKAPLTGDSVTVNFSTRK